MNKKLGIIGGMGPLATADMFKKIILLTEAESDQEHIHMIIDNNTNIPDRTDYILNGKNNPLKEILKSVSRLESLEVDCIIMPCHTAHFFYDDIVKNPKTKILNMLDETAEYIRINYPCSNVGILSSEGTKQSKIYDRIFEKFNIKLIKTDNAGQEIISNAIYDLKSGCFNPDESKIGEVIADMKLSGMEICILGCTELPIIFSMIQNGSITVIDPTLILAESAIKYLGKNVKKQYL